jgi:hypothetical protein
MKTIEDINKSKVPIVIIDEKLNQYKGTILFPNQLAMANAFLDKVGLPKNIEKKIKRRSKKKSYA